jgi:hypothetical protein
VVDVGDDGNVTNLFHRYGGGEPEKLAGEEVLYKVFLVAMD